MLLGRAVRLAQRRLKIALQPRRPSLRTRATLAQASGQLWGQFRGALAFRVAPPRPKPGREAVPPPGDMALTPRA